MKKIITVICIVAVMFIIVYTAKSYIDDSVTEETKEYSYTNKTLSPIKVEFKADICINQNADGQYYISNADYKTPLAVNKNEDSFQIASTTAELSSDSTSYVITALGRHTKDGNDMGDTKVSACYYIDINTGKICVSNN